MYKLSINPKILHTLSSNFSSNHASTTIKQCKYFNNQTCPDEYCQSGGLCITINLREVTEKRPFEETFPICSDFQENIYYTQIDFTHQFLFWVYFRYTNL